MVCYFIGGAIGSVSAGTLYASHGWAGVCLLGTGFGVLTLAMSVYERVRPVPPRQSPPPPAPAQAPEQADAGAGAQPSTISSPLPS
jgi:hypothetical protein